MPVSAPRRVKFRKMFKGQMPGMSTRGATLAFGDYGIKAMSRGWVSARQIEAARKALTHFTAKGGRVWIRIFPDKPITKKAEGSKIGVGKGEVHMYVCVVRPGRIMFEMGGLSKDQAEEAIRRAGFKLPVKTRLITKEHHD
jgi:large subunit ribosomal protein L16